MCDQGVAGPHGVVGCHVMNGWTVVEANGEIDVAFSPLVREAVVRLLAEGQRHFVLDLCGAPFLDSTGLGMIVAVTKRIQARHGSLRIACADKRLLRVFTLGGLRPVYSFHDSAEQATAQPPSSEGLADWPHRRR
ncbi:MULTISPECIES: STAS domain-containing protein [unclassified Streptomyces]|uniref:STAS domain-containing protein n=1 Tax=unclassified Streptomyces TaxID=2593676 RepID=UPI0028773605|nr:STAS domain-containing protein [Streptomyces sp. BB1-1-1]WND33058.1 STAS domain-containing protein [Streptomyces sp. BB1-1-1]